MSACPASRHAPISFGNTTLSLPKARVKVSQPTLEELTQAVFALRQEMTSAVTQGLVEQVHRALVALRMAACPRFPGANRQDAGGRDPPADGGVA
jgi:hypothetical protein